MEKDGRCAEDAEGRDVAGKYEPGAELRCLELEGGWENALGCGVKQFVSVPTPNAVAVSSSSSSLLCWESASEGLECMPSLEEVMTLSDSLSLSSHSS